MSEYRNNIIEEESGKNNDDENAGNLEGKDLSREDLEGKIVRLKKEIEDINSAIQENKIMEKYGKKFGFNKEDAYQYVEDLARQKEEKIREAKAEKRKQKLKIAEKINKIKKKISEFEKQAGNENLDSFTRKRNIEMIIEKEEVIKELEAELGDENLLKEEDGKTKERKERVIELDEFKRAESRGKKKTEVIEAVDLHIAESDFKTAKEYIDLFEEEAEKAPENEEFIAELRDRVAYGKAKMVYVSFYGDYKHFKPKDAVGVLEQIRGNQGKIRALAEKDKMVIEKINTLLDERIAELQGKTGEDKNKTVEELDAAAAAAGVKPEDVEGKKGGDGKEGEEGEPASVDLPAQAGAAAGEGGEEKKLNSLERFYTEMGILTTIIDIKKSVADQSGAKKIKDMEKNYDDLCLECERFMVEEIKRGALIDEIKEEAERLGDSKIIEIAGDLENSLKFMDPKKVKEKFEDELEYLISGERRKIKKEDKSAMEDKLIDMARGLGLLNEEQLAELQKSEMFFGKKISKEILFAELKEIKEEAENWAKIDKYYREVEEKKAKRKGDNERNLEGKKRKGGKIGGIIKNKEHMLKGMAEIAMAFQASHFTVGAVGSAIFGAGFGATGGGIAAAVAGAAGAVVCGRKLFRWGGEKFLREKRARKMDVSQEEVLDKMATLISVHQMDRLDVEKKVMEKNYRKMEEKYIRNEISEDDWKNFLIEAANEKMGNSKKERTTSKKKSKAVFEINRLDAQDYSQEALINKDKALLMLDLKEREREAGIKRKIYETAGQGHSLRDEEIAKKVKTETMGEKVGKAASLYGKELGTLAAFESPARLPLMLFGGAQMGMVDMEILFEDKKWYQENYMFSKKIKGGRWLAQTIGAGAGALTLSWLISGRKAEATEHGGGFEKIAGWAKGKTEGMIEDWKQEGDMFSSLLFKPGEFFNKWKCGIKARHGIGESEARVKSDFAEAMESAKEKYKLSPEEVRELRGVISNIDGEKALTAYAEQYSNRSESAFEFGPKKELRIKQEVLDAVRERIEAGKAVKESAIVQGKTAGEIAPAAGGVERITVKSGDKVWNIAEEMESKLEIKRPEVPKELTGQAKADWETARDTYITDAVKDEMAAQMKGQGFKDAGLIKEGQSFDIDKGDVMEGLKRRKIIVDEANNIKQLTPKEVENILKNNEMNRESARARKADIRVTNKMVNKGDGVGLSDGQRNGAINEIFQLKLQNSKRYKKENKLNSNQYEALIEKIKANDSNKNDFSLEDKIAFLKNENQWIKEIKEGPRKGNADLNKDEKFTKDFFEKKRTESMNEMKGKPEEPVVNRNTLEAVESRKVKMEGELADGRELTRECQEFYERLWKKDEALWREKVASEDGAGLKGNELSTPDFNEESNAGKISDFLRIKKYLGKEKMNKLITTSEEMEIAKKLSNFGFKGKAFDEKFQNSKKCFEVLGRTRKDMDLSRKADFLEMWVKPEKGNIGEYLQQEGFRIPDTDRLQWTWDAKGGKLIIKNGVEIKEGIPQKLTIYLEGEHTGEYGRRNWWGSNRWFKTRNGFMKDLDKKK